MSRANYLETILNNLNGTAIYVIDRESHKILYFNDCVRDIVPGDLCSDVWNHDGEKCPLTGITPTGSKTITRFNKTFNKTLDLTATPVTWGHDEAYIISMAPHKQSETGLKLELERKKLGTIAAKPYPRAISVNLTQNSYSILHDDLSITAQPEPIGVYDELLDMACGCIHPDFRDEFINRFSRKHLLDHYACGEKEILMEHRQLNTAGEYEWTGIESEAKKAGINAFVPRPLFKSYLANVLKAGKENTKTVHKTKTEMPRFTGKTILLVEDNELNAEIAAELIAMTGASVDTVSNGKAAIEKFRKFPENHYGLIFMDIQMPVMNNHEATVAIRKLDRHDAKTIPIISMSASTFPDDIRLANPV